jgi:diguanylate cyclase (GGDEF)-like protein
MSVVRVTALPALGLAISVGVGVASLGAAATAGTQRQQVLLERKPLRQIEALNQARVGAQQALAEYWNRELGQRADISGTTDNLRRALSDPLIESEAIKSARQLLETIKTTPSTKNQMGLLGEIAATVDKAIDEVGTPLGGRAQSFRSASGIGWTVAGMATLTTELRVLKKIDPAPRSEEVLAYIQGEVAGYSEDAKGSFVSALTRNLPKGSQVRADLLAVSRAPEVQTFAREFTWAARGGSGTIDHASFADFNTSRRITAEKAANVYVRELRRVDRLVVNEAQSLQSNITRSRRIAWGSAAGVIGALFWLFGRLGSRLRALRKLAETDSLTGTLNRPGVKRLVDPWFADRGRNPVAIAVIDLDKFKAVNDTYGHAGGDAVLRSVATQLRSTTIPDYTAIGRWGGDEFVAVFRFPLTRLGPSNDIDMFDGVFERVHTSIASPLMVDGTLVSVTATLGVAVCTCGSCDFEDLFRVADRALYVGKFEGRDQWSSVRCDFDPTDRMDSSISNRTKLASVS